MKEEEVPQDDENMLEGKMRELQYAIDENGNYKAVKSVGWEPKNIVLKDVWKEWHEELEEAKVKVEKEGYSPLYYHMKKNSMNISLLAKYSGFSRFKVKRHLKMKAYSKLSTEKKIKYVEAFNYKSVLKLEELK